MAFLPANLVKDSVVYMGGLTSGSDTIEAAEFSALASGGTLAGLDTAVGVTANAATKNGWTRLSQQGWGFAADQYQGPVVELREQPGADVAVYRQSLEVTDLEWGFTIDVNPQTLLIFGNVRQERRRFLVADLGTAVGSIVDQFVAWVTAPTGSDGGAKQFRVQIRGHGPLAYVTLT